MEHNRKQKLLMIIALVLSIVSLSIGFSAFSTTLNISSSASVNPSSDSFSVKFSTSQNSLVVGAVTPSSNPFGLTTSNGTITNGASPTLSNVSATFTSPGQYVEYTFYARNEGEYTAYLNNINFLGDKTCTGETGTTTSLVTSACESINISATIGNNAYTETTPIEGHTLAKGVGEQIKIRLEYSSSGTTVDGPFLITFPDVALVYSTVNDSSTKPATKHPTTSQKVVKLESGDLSTPGSIVSIGDEQFYVFGQEDGNVKLLSMYILYVGGYYNGIWNAYGDEATGIQDSTLGGNEGVQAFSTKSYWSSTVSSYPSYVYDSNSMLYSYIEDYKTYLGTLGVTPSEARLITYEELINLGCSGDDFSCSGAQSFVYSASYWTGSAYDSNYVYVVEGETFRHYNPGSDDSMGVRPVIEIPLSEF